MATNVLAWILFAADKAAAQEHRRRVPEGILLLVALVGGSVGAVCAQRLLRHKTVKQPFATHLGIIVLVEALGVLAAAVVFIVRAESGPGS